MLTDLLAAARPHGLTFGADPSSASRATIGGMIANNACGAHSVAWGTTADNVRSLDVILADGTRCTVESRGSPRSNSPAGQGVKASCTDRCRPLSMRTSWLIRRRFGQLHPADLGLRAAPVAARTRLRRRGSAVRQRRRIRGNPAGDGGADTAAERRGCCVCSGFADSVTSAECVPVVLAHSPLTMESINIDLVDRLPGEVRRAATEAGCPRDEPGCWWRWAARTGAAAAMSAEKMLDALRDSGSPAIGIPGHRPGGSGGAVAVPDGRRRAGDPPRRRRRGVGRLGGRGRTAGTPRPTTCAASTS